MEPECKNERVSLIKLIRKYKEMISSLVKNNNAHITNDPMFISLRNAYSEAEQKLIDTDYFHCLLGKTFDDDVAKESDLNDLKEGIDANQALIDEESKVIFEKNGSNAIKESFDDGEPLSCCDE